MAKKGGVKAGKSMQAKMSTPGVKQPAGMKVKDWMKPVTMKDQSKKVKVPMGSNNSDGY
jgi:hypothetical protein